jgi:hypothetical protein
MMTSQPYSLLNSRYKINIYLLNEYQYNHLGNLQLKNTIYTKMFNFVFFKQKQKGKMNHQLIFDFETNTKQNKKAQKHFSKLNLTFFVVDSLCCCKLRTLKIFKKNDKNTFKSNEEYRILSL